MQDILLALIEGVKKVLPLSPFSEWISQMGELPYLSWLNWFFPVGTCLAIMKGWLGIVAAYYVYSILLRWIKAVD